MDAGGGRKKGRKDEKEREQHHRRFQVHDMTDEKCHTPSFPVHKRVCVCVCVNKWKRINKNKRIRPDMLSFLVTLTYIQIKPIGVGCLSLS